MSKRVGVVEQQALSEQAVQDRQPEAAMAQSSGAATLSVFERLALDPKMDVDKLERLMAMHERGAAKWAEEQFNQAMNAAQQEMRPVAADASNPQTKSMYASYAALDKAMRPLYTKHGFALSFDTADAPFELMVRVQCYVSHSGGHSRTYHVDIPADGKGARGNDVMTRTHAVGAALSYGARYLLKMIFNVAVGEDDDDGNGATAPAVEAPQGYADWLTDMRSAADTGLQAVRKAFKDSKEEFRDYIQRHEHGKLEEFRARGKAADDKAATQGDS